MIELRGVSKSFGGVAALADVSATFPTHGTCAVLGPNGSGKSSLLSIIAGFYRPDAGELYWAGPPRLPLNGVPAASRARIGIGLMFQEPRGFPEMSVEDNLLLHALPKGSDDLLATGFTGLPRRRLGAEVARLLELGSLKGARRTRLGELSYGQRRLVDLLGLVLSGTRVYLLDEPFAGIDPRNLDTVLAILRERGRADNAMVLLVSHELTLVRELADYVFVLDQGRVALQGHPVQVLESDDFRRVYLG